MDARIFGYELLLTPCLYTCLVCQERCWGRDDWTELNGLRDHSACYKGAKVYRWTFLVQICRTWGTKRKRYWGKSYIAKFLQGEPTWHTVLPDLSNPLIHPLSSDPSISAHSDFHMKTHEAEIPPLLFDHHNCDLFDQVRPIHWVDPKAEVFHIYLS